MVVPFLSNAALIPVFVFAAVFVFLIAAILVVRRRSAYRGSVESRLHTVQQPKIRSQEEMIHIRRSRSLSSEGHYLLPMVSLNKLLLQSGTSLGFSGLLAVMGAVGAVFFFAAQAAGLGLVLAALCGSLAGVSLPIASLRGKRDQRQRKFEAQIPDALDTVVRSS